MDARIVRALAALSVLLVVAFGVLWNREAFLEQNEGGTLLGETSGVVRVDAGLGVRVHVEGQTGLAGVVWRTRAWFAHAEVTRVGPGHVTAICQSPTPFSRCAIWVSVTSASPDDRVEVVLHQDAWVDGAVEAPNVTIERNP